MVRWLAARLVLVLFVSAVAGWSAAPAVAGWRLARTTTASLSYNQGITFDQASGNFFLDGVISPSNSALFRADATLSQNAQNTAVIPPTTEGYNHVGDLSFDSLRRRLVLPLECYYPFSTPSNTCGKGAFGVVDPTTLGFRYYVNLWKPQIQKAMWDEISPDSGWIWTSSGTHLLAYKAASVNQQTAAYQRAGVWGGLGGKDLGAVLPTGNVTGAAFVADPTAGGWRLFLALNRGTYFQVVSYPVGTAADGTPALLSSIARIEITVRQSFSNYESEGLAVTPAVNGPYPLGGILHWQMLPYFTLYSRILNYTAN